MKPKQDSSNLLTGSRIKAATGKEVGLLGLSVDCGNRGVQALGTALMGLCMEVVPNARPVLLIGHNRHEVTRFRLDRGVQQVPVVPARLSPRANPRDHLLWIVLASLAYRLVPLAGFRGLLKKCFPWIREAAHALVVGDIRGGDSFSDIYGMGRFLTGFLMAWSVVLVRGGIVQFPQTYGPYKSGLDRLLAGYLLRRSQVIMARDRVSLKVAQELVGGGREVLLCPDVAFVLKAERPKAVALDPPLGEGEVPSNTIGLNVNGLMHNGGYTRQNMFGLRMDYRNMLPRLVERLLEVHEGELWLVPHAFSPPGNVESDPEACWKVREALPEKIKNRTRILVGDYDCCELKWLIGQCNFFLGSRMHSCIAALSQGVPCVGIAYSRKFEGVFDTVGMADWVIDGRKVQNEDAISRIIELYKNRDDIRPYLKTQAEEARSKLYETFSALFSSISN